VDVHEVLFPDPVRLGWIERARGGSYWVRGRTRWLPEGATVRVPWIELRRAALLWKDAGIRGIRIRYVRRGVEREVSDAVIDLELTRPLSFWSRRFLAYREVERGDNPVACRW